MYSNEPESKQSVSIETFEEIGSEDDLLRREDAAVIIQSEWRKHRRAQRRDRFNRKDGGDSCKMVTLLKANDELLAKLDAVRQSKAYAMMKYETIARMHAGDVNAYLKREQSRATPLKPAYYETDNILARHRDATAHNAAILIQRFVGFAFIHTLITCNIFRECLRKKREEITLREWKRVSPQRRVQLISAIADRMAVGDVPRRNDLASIKNKAIKLSERKRGLATAVSAFERRERTIAKLDRDLQLLKDISSLDDLLVIDPRCLGSNRVALRQAEDERSELLRQHDDRSLIEGSNPPL